MTARKSKTHEGITRRQAGLRLFRSLRERFIVWLIHLCGISAILFVFSIFYFIFREGAPFIEEELGFREFFLSEEWFPTSETNKRYGILALLLGTGSVTVLDADIPEATPRLGLGHP